MADLSPAKPADISLESTSEPVFVRSQPGEVARVVVLGALVGLLTAFLGWVLARFVIEPVFCGSSEAAASCQNSSLTAYYVAAVATGLGATVVLANWQVFRPLLIVVATLATLWGFQKYVGTLAGQSPVEYHLYSALLFALCYLLFYWLLRLHNFVVSLVFVVAAVVGIRMFVVS